MVQIKELNVPKPRLYDSHNSKIRLAKKMGERDPNPIFILPRLPKEDMLQLADELSEIHLPCKVNDELVDEFYEDSSNSTERRSQSSEEDLQEEESEEDQDLYQSFIDSDQSINQSNNQSIRIK